MLFTFPSRYWFTIGLGGVFSLSGWSRQFHTGFLVSRATQDTAINYKCCLYGTFTLYGSNFHYDSSSFYNQTSQSYNPDIAATTSVWANARSLATTCAITFVFFSCGYLDVSVPHVCLPFGMSYLQYDGLPHSDICGSKVICTSPQLFAAYHVLLRLPEPRHPPFALAFFFSFRLITLYNIYNAPNGNVSHCFSLILLVFFSSFQFVKELL